MKTSVYYNPNNPQQAVIKTGASFWTNIPLIFGFFITRDLCSDFVENITMKAMPNKTKIIGFGLIAVYKLNKSLKQVRSTSQQDNKTKYSKHFGQPISHKSLK